MSGQHFMTGKRPRYRLNGRLGGLSEGFSEKQCVRGIIGLRYKGEYSRISRSCDRAS